MFLLPDIFRYVFSAPGQLLESMPGTLMLTDCLEACQSNDTCGSVNYETGLCVLFSSNADKLPGMCVSCCIEYAQILYQKLLDARLFGTGLCSILDFVYKFSIVREVCAGGKGRNCKNGRNSQLINLIFINVM